jgi:hypothetical protein
MSGNFFKYPPLSILETGPSLGPPEFRLVRGLLGEGCGGAVAKAKAAAEEFNPYPPTPLPLSQ